MQFLPFLALVAPVASVALLIGEYVSGDLERRGAIALGAMIAAAAYCQFFAGAAIVSAMGLAMQTLLAIYLILRWRLST